MNYEKIYNAIVNNAISEDRKKIKGEVYYESHHIIPRCMGGEGMTYQHNHPNIVLLTAKEHYICHKLLVLIYPNNKKLQYALWCMINGLTKSKKRYIPSARIYNRLKEEYNKIPISDKTRKKMASRICSEETRVSLSIAARNRLPHSEETRKKMSEAAEGKPKGPMSIEHKKKISESNKGNIRLPMSEETKKKISDSKKGKLRGSYNKKLN